MWNSKVSNVVLVVSLILGLAFFAGCGGDDDPVDPTGGGINTITGGTITVTLDGTAVDFSTNAGAVNLGDPDWRQISGTNAAATESMIIGVLGVTGTYDLADMNGPSVVMTYNSGVWSAVSGTLVLTTATDTKLVGTFSGTFGDMSMNTMVVTNGVFDVPLVLVTP